MSDTTVGSSPGVYRFRVWFVTVFLAGMVAVTVAMRLAVGISWTVVIAAPIGGTFAFWHAMALRVDASGVRIGRLTARWADLSVREGRWGESLRGAASGGGSTRLNVFLPSYFDNWRAGGIGADLRVWAPHLFTASERSG